MGYDDIPKEIQQFWVTLNWRENPWIRDQGSHMLPRTKHNRIVNCTLDQLHILRTGPAEFVLRVPVPQSQRVPHSDAKLRRWATSLLLLCPDLPIGKVLSSSPLLRLRQAPPGLRRYSWGLLGDGIIKSRSTEIENGLLWRAL